VKNFRGDRRLGHIIRGTVELGMLEPYIEPEVWGRIITALKR
jgi:hypothetical protein